MGSVQAASIVATMRPGAVIGREVRRLPDMAGQQLEGGVGKVGHWTRAGEGSA